MTGVIGREMVVKMLRTNVFVDWARIVGCEDVLSTFLITSHD